MTKTYANKAVILGWSGSSALDEVQTPLHPKSPGMVIHAAMFNGIVTGAFWRPVPAWVTILIILGMALGLTSYLIDAQVPMHMLAAIQRYIDSRLMFLLALNVFLLLAGCLMDIFSAIIVIVPLIVPIAREFDVHPLHLGIIFLTNLEIGYSTPPVGLNFQIGEEDDAA